MPPTLTDLQWQQARELAASTTRWTPQHARQLLDLQQQSGLTVMLFAQHLQLCGRRLYWWRQKFQSHTEINSPTPNSSNQTQTITTSPLEPQTTQGLDCDSMPLSPTPHTAPPGAPNPPTPTRDHSRSPATYRTELSTQSPPPTIAAPNTPSPNPTAEDNPDTIFWDGDSPSPTEGVPHRDPANPPASPSQGPHTPNLTAGVPHRNPASPPTPLAAPPASRPAPRRHPHPTARTAASTPKTSATPPATAAQTSFPTSAPAPGVKMSAPATIPVVIQEADTASGGSGKHPEEADMLHAGMDLHKDTTTLHVTDGSGSQILLRTLPTTEEDLGAVMRQELKTFTRFYLEAGTASAWMARFIEAHGHEAIVVDPNRLRLISGSTKKTDKHDAAVLAQLGRTGLLNYVHVRKPETDAIRTIMTARRVAVQARTKLAQVVRAMHRAHGQHLPKLAPEALGARLLSEGTTLEEGAAIQPLAELMVSASTQIAALESELVGRAGEHQAELSILQEIPGVGTLISLGFLSHLEDVHRFRRAEQVSAYLGLTPWVRESGGRRRTGGITGHGNRALRKDVIQGAWSLMRSRQDSALKQWGEELMRRVGKKKGIVGVARKLVEVMWRLLKKGERWQAFPPGCGRTPRSTVAAVAGEAQPI